MGRVERQMLAMFATLPLAPRSKFYLGLTSAKPGPRVWLSDIQTETFLTDFAGAHLRRQLVWQVSLGQEI